MTALTPGDAQAENPHNHVDEKQKNPRNITTSIPQPTKLNKMEENRRITNSGIS